MSTQERGSSDSKVLGEVNRSEAAPVLVDDWWLDGLWVATRSHGLDAVYVEDLVWCATNGRTQRANELRTDEIIPMREAFKDWVAAAPVEAPA